jgi:hypothetical protein
MEGTPMSSALIEQADPFHEIKLKLDAAAQRFEQDALFVFVDSLGQFAEAHLRLFDSLVVPASNNREAQRNAHLQVIRELAALWREFQSDQLPIIQQYLQVGCRRLAQSLEAIIDEAPDNYTFTLTPDQIHQQEQDGTILSRQKNWKLWRHQLTGQPIVHQVKLRKLLAHDWQAIYLRNFHSVLNTLNLAANDHLTGLATLIQQQIARSFPGMIRALEEHDPTLADTVAGLKHRLKEQNQRLVEFLGELHSLMEIRLRNEIQQLDINQQIKQPGWDATRHKKALEKFGENWAGNMALLFSQQQTDFQLLELRAQLIWMGRGILSELEFRCFTSTESALIQLRDEAKLIRQLVGEQKWEDLQRLTLDPSALLILADERIISSAMAHLVQHISLLPEQIAFVPASAWSQVLDGSGAVLSSEPFEVAEMVNYLTKTYYLAPLEEAIHHLPETFKELYHRVQGAIRLITFHLPNGESSVEDANLQTVIQRSESQFEQALQQLHAHHQEIIQMLQEVEAKVLALMAVRPLHQESLEWKLSGPDRTVPRRKLEVVRNRISNWYRSRFDWVSQRVNQAQDHLLLADVQRNQEHASHGIAHIRQFGRLIIPEEATLNDLPYYYKQLFIGNQRIARKLMVGRENELSQASRVAKLMQQGPGGAMMIIGEPQSGKTYFSEYVGDSLFPGKVVQIAPPLAGSRKSADLRAAFRARLSSSGSLIQMIQAELPGTVFLIDDLELWWERSQQGDQAILSLFRVIDKVGADYPFILNCNQFTYGLLIGMLRLEAHISETIFLQPLSLQKVEQCLVDRHKSSALSFQLNGTHERDIRPRALRKFFRRLYHYSKGNIGFALRMWLSSIQGIEEESITLLPPPVSEIPGIENPDWLVLLTQFVLHKRLNLDRLKRIYHLESPHMLKEHVFQLVRANLLVEISPGLYELNPYLTSYVIHLLQKDRLL